MLVQWDDGHHQHEIESKYKNVVVERLVALDGVDRTLVVVFLGEKHMACGGNTESGLVLYGTYDNDEFMQLADPTVVTGHRSTNVAGGQAGEYEARFVVDLEKAKQAMLHFISSGNFSPDLTWVRQ
jgi:hypothetical protein